MINERLPKGAKIGRIVARIRQAAAIGEQQWNKISASYRGHPRQRNESVFQRLTGALIRAILVIIVIATPALMLPGVSSDATQVVALVAIFSAVLTFFEYASTYPGLIEFRDAPPFNRIRYVSLLATVFLLSVAALADTEHATLTDFVQVLGAALAHTIDFPYSPVRLLVLILPEDSSAAHVEQVRTAAGIAYMISLITLGYFVIILRTMGWPKSAGGFNVWINLPTFDPTAGGDVVNRLRRDALLNAALGFLLPFIIPAALKMVSATFEPVTFASTQTMIWSVSAWAFLPASLFMRGIAMNRIASMIEEKRRMNTASDAAEFTLPATTRLGQT
jgi:hypothetical protein